MIRAKLFEKKTFTKNLASSMTALHALVALLGKLTSECAQQKTDPHQRESDTSKLEAINAQLLLNASPDLMARIRHQAPTASDITWMKDRTTESSNIITLFGKYLEKIYDTLHNPDKPPKTTVELFEFVLEKPTTTTELRKMFSDTKSGVVSGPSGINKGHLMYAPDHVLEALLPVVHDMLDGNYPDCQKIGAIAPKPKDLHRFRPITLLEYLYRAVDTRVTKRLLEVIEKLKLVDHDQFGSIRGGSTSAAIDILRLAVEDSNFHQKPLWLTLLDCSEAFDSLDDVITDISFQSLGTFQNSSHDGPAKPAATSAESSSPQEESVH